MTLDGFLTVLTIVIAAYAVMPTAARLRIGLFRRWLGILSLAAFIGVLYFEFFSLLAVPCPSWIGAYCKIVALGSDKSISSQQAAFIVVLIWLGAVSFLLRRSNVPTRSMPVLSRLVSIQMERQQYADVIDLIEPHLALVNKVAARRTVFARLHDRLIALDDQDNPIGYLERENLDVPWRNKILRKLSIFVPSDKRLELAATSILTSLFRSPKFVEYIVKHRPAFGVELLSVEVWAVNDFSDDFFTQLISVRGSLLYEEVRQNQNLSRCGYVIPSQNRILNKLFSDALVAERLAVYKPIGDFVISCLNAENVAYARFINGPATDFDERECWSDPVFVGLRFFDIMVTSAACQNVGWHMWLYYYPAILKEIVEIHDASGEAVDVAAEWPTRGSYLIYCIISTLRNWIRITSALPDGSRHRVIRSVSPIHENGNIPKSAALALGQSMKVLLESNRIDDRFQKYLHEIVMRLVSDLPAVPNALRRATINSIVKRGGLGTDPEYGAKLRRLWAETDVFLRRELADYEGVLNESYPKS